MSLTAKVPARDLGAFPSDPPSPSPRSRLLSFQCTVTGRVSSLLSHGHGWPKTPLVLEFPVPTRPGIFSPQDGRMNSPRQLRSRPAATRSQIRSCQLPAVPVLAAPGAIQGHGSSCHPSAFSLPFQRFYVPAIEALSSSRTTGTSSFLRAR